MNSIGEFADTFFVSEPAPPAVIGPAWATKVRLDLECSQGLRPTVSRGRCWAALGPLGFSGVRC